MVELSNRVRSEPSLPALDRIDFEILEALQNNARLSNKELAASVELAPSSCLARVRKLERAGVLRGYHAHVAPKALGIGLQALVAVRMRSHAREAFDAFRERVIQLPEVVALYQLGGADDFLVHVAARDADHLRDVVLDELARREEVAHLETSLIFGYHRVAALPSLSPRGQP